jgi:hypothetical protein
MAKRKSVEADAAVEPTGGVDVNPDGFHRPTVFANAGADAADKHLDVSDPDD